MMPRAHIVKHVADDSVVLHFLQMAIFEHKDGLRLVVNRSRIRSTIGGALRHGIRLWCRCTHVLRIASCVGSAWLGWAVAFIGCSRVVRSIVVKDGRPWSVVSVVGLLSGGIDVGAVHAWVGQIKRIRQGVNCAAHRKRTTMRVAHSRMGRSGMGPSGLRRSLANADARAGHLVTTSCVDSCWLRSVSRADTYWRRPCVNLSVRT
jgi:hypothetical protein